MKLIASLTFLFLGIFQTVYAQYGPGYKERGIISYYTAEYEDRTTASGEKFDNNDLVGCHNHIPYNSKVKITNLSNNRSVIVRINDRGPYAYGRVMDISRAAAKKIGLISTGTAKVEIIVIDETKPLSQIEKETTPSKDKNENQPVVTATSESEFKLNKTYNERGVLLSPKGYSVQVAGLSTAQKAKDYCRYLRGIGFKEDKLFIFVGTKNGKRIYKVRIGEFATREQSSSTKNLVLSRTGKAGFTTTHN